MLEARKPLRSKAVDAVEATAPNVTGEAAKAKPPMGATDVMFHLLAVMASLRDVSLDERLQPLNLNVNRYRALAVIEAFGPCTMSTFSGFSPLDRSTTTRLVDVLVSAGWVSRSRAPDDRRYIYIALTKSGAALCARAKAIVSRHNAALAEGLDDELKSQIIAAGLMLTAKLELGTDDLAGRVGKAEISLAKAKIVS